MYVYLKDGYANPHWAITTKVNIIIFVSWILLISYFKLILFIKRFKTDKIGLKMLKSNVRERYLHGRFTNVYKNTILRKSYLKK